MKHKIRIQSRVSGGSDLLLVSQNSHRGVDRLLCVYLSCKGRIRANPVILPVSAYHTGVKAHIPGLYSGNHLNLSAEEILFRNSVFLV